MEGRAIFGFINGNQVSMQILSDLLGLGTIALSRDEFHCRN